MDERVSAIAAQHSCPAAGMPRVAITTAAAISVIATGHDQLKERSTSHLPLTASADPPDPSAPGVSSLVSELQCQQEG